MELYLAQRGDANIKTFKELLAKSLFYNDPSYSNPRARLEEQTKAMEYDSAARMQLRFAVQQIILQGMADMKLDALVYPTGNIPPTKLGAPTEPSINGRGSVWTFLGMQGFPAITVPAGFTTVVYDRVRDAGVTSTPSTEGAGGGGTPVPSHMVGPIPAVLPVGVDFLGRPFSEPTLLKIAGAWEHAAHPRHPPPDFGPIPGEP
jgi:Asp-tRNA(Asn)/Glu-tRNA(Gln) amidotransferase A subunit family amidase